MPKGWYNIDGVRVLSPIDSDWFKHAYTPWGARADKQADIDFAVVKIKAPESSVS